MKRCEYDLKPFAIEARQTLFRQIKVPLMTKDQFGPHRNNAVKACVKAIGQPNRCYAELRFIESYSFTNGVPSGAVAGTWHQRSCLRSLYLKVSLREWLASDDEYGGRSHCRGHAQEQVRDRAAACGAFPAP